MTVAREKLYGAVVVLLGRVLGPNTRNLLSHILLHGYKSAAEGARVFRAKYSLRWKSDRDLHR